MLVDVADRLGSESVSRVPAAAGGRHRGRAHVPRKGRRARDDPKQRRLARAARAEDDNDLAFGDLEREALERSGASLAGRVP